MIELIFVACLAASNSTCGEKQILQLPGIGLMGCMTTAQARLAQWSEAHPGYEIARWSCGWSNPDEREA